MSSLKTQKMREIIASRILDAGLPYVEIAQKDQQDNLFGNTEGVYIYLLKNPFFIVEICLVEFFDVSQVIIQMNLTASLNADGEETQRFYHPHIDRSTSFEQGVDHLLRWLKEIL